MNTTKAVYNKLFNKKTELETHKIELGLVDDALQFTKGVEVFGKNIDISAEQLEKTFRALRVDLSDLQKDLNALKKGRKAVEKAAQDLGIKVNEIPKYKESEKALKYGEEQIAKAKSLLK